MSKRRTPFSALSAGLNRAMVQSLPSADPRAKLAGTGLVAMPSTPEELRKRHEA